MAETTARKSQLETLPPTHVVPALKESMPEPLKREVARFRTRVVAMRCPGCGRYGEPCDAAWVALKQLAWEHGWSISMNVGHETREDWSLVERIWATNKEWLT